MKTEAQPSLSIETTTVFNKDVENLHKQRGGKKSLKTLADVIDMIIKREVIPDRHKFHKLKGDLIGHLSCHVHNDLCLIWRLNKDGKSVTFCRLGTHSDIYG